MALLILTMILSAITYFSALEINISERRLVEGFENALENLVSPDSTEERIVVKESLILSANTYVSRSFSTNYDIKEECIEFQSSKLSTYDVSSNRQAITIHNQVETNVYFLCIKEETDECEVYCYISFGKKPEV